VRLSLALLAGVGIAILLNRFQHPHDKPEDAAFIAAAPVDFVASCPDFMNARITPVPMALGYENQSQ
jgi:hypothetical protein